MRKEKGSDERCRNCQRRTHGTKWQGRIVEVAEEEEEKKKQRRRIRGKWQRSSRGSIMGELGKWQRRAREVAETDIDDAPEVYFPPLFLLSVSWKPLRRSRGHA
jgi:hypothetical protein